MSDHDTVTELARQLRVDAVRASGEAGSGHPTSGMSAAELVAVLATGHLRSDVEHPDDPHNDELVFSKGHATPLLYAWYKAVGAIDDQELLTYRQAGSRLEGHPAPTLPWVSVATGSLGQGLPLAAGLALTAKRLDGLDPRVWVLCGDSEMTEGSMWEAAELAAHEGLDNLVAIVDVNRLGQRGATRYGWNLDAYTRRLRAFGWDAIEVDGHDVEEIDAAYRHAVDTATAPVAVVARTVKGYGLTSIEDRNGHHGKPVADVEAAVDELGGRRDLRVSLPRPETTGDPRVFEIRARDAPSWELGEELPTRQAFGESLAALGSSRGDVVVLDGEVSNSTKTAIFEEAHPERFFQMYIAEQQMLAAAVAMQTRGWTPFVTSFAAFLTRAHDFLRMAAVSRAKLCVAGSHSGVSIGQDGPSQMGLEDLAMFRSIHGSTVLHPCDANQTAALVESMVDHEGISYLRTLRGATPVVYSADESFAPGGSKVLRSSEGDDVTLVAAGVTVHEALDAAERLASRGVTARVVDAYSVKPVDADTLREAAEATEGRIVTVEDHWADGGLGDAVLDALSGGERSLRVEKLAVRRMPGSAPSDEQRAAAGIDADHIATRAANLVG